MDKSFGERIKALRTERGLSIDLLVWDMNKKYDLNISKGTISRWENNITEPSLNLARAYADYFNVSLDYLIGLTDDRTPVRMLSYYKENRSKQTATKKEPSIESIAERDITLVQAIRLYKKYQASSDIIRSKIDFLLEQNKKPRSKPKTDFKRDLDFKVKLDNSKSDPDFPDIKSLYRKAVIKHDD